MMELAMISSFGEWFTSWFTSEWLLALIVTILLVDIIFYGTTLGHFAVILTSLWLYLRFGPWGKWTVLVAILIFLGVYASYFCIYVPLVKLVQKMFQKGSPDEELHRIIGQTGRIRIVSGTTMFKWDGELWPIQEEHPSFNDGEVVKCVAFTDGIAIVEKVQN